MAQQNIVIFTVVILSLIGCSEATSPTIQTRDEAVVGVPTANASNRQLTPEHELSDYEFPESIDPANQYMFYLHGKIIEDQGIPATSPAYGDYEYEAILEELNSHEFVIISEQRPENTDSVAYARKVASQVETLLDAGVPAKNITVVGASKGGAITIFVSHFLENEELNFVIMAICHPDIVTDLMRDQISLSGHVLSIYDSVDEYAGSCRELFIYSEGKGISIYDEVVLNIGTGHGILYQPLDEWILPTVQWANNYDE